MIHIHETNYSNRFIGNPSTGASGNIIMVACSRLARREDYSKLDVFISPVVNGAMHVSFYFFPSHFFQRPSTDILEIFHMTWL